MEVLKHSAALLDSRPTDILSAFLSKSQLVVTGAAVYVVHAE